MYISIDSLIKSRNRAYGLKLNIEKMKIMASGPITSWQIDGEIEETVTDFIFLGGGLPNHCRWWLHMKLKDAYSLEEELWPT